MNLTLEGVTKSVGGSEHIAGVSLTLAPGTINVLLGPTLAGKTTLMRLMAGLEKPTSGRVLVDGKDVTGVPVQRRDVAMVYQQFINYPPSPSTRTSPRRCVSPGGRRPRSSAASAKRPGS